MREQDRAKFVELANKRVNSAIKTLRLIGNLSNHSNYDYTEGDVEAIFRTLSKELRNAKKRFNNAASPRDVLFRLE